jgi:flagellar M-ring protein FliF
MNAVVQSMRSLGAGKIAAMVGVAVAMIAFFIYLTSRLATPQMELLYGELDPTDTKQVVTKLDQMKVPYDIRANGTQVFVTADQVAKMRVMLAEQSLPSGGGGVVGYEIFDKGDALGSTSFMQNVNLIRATEGELARTIRAIAGVKAARVHLVLPKREAFTRDMQEPSASIFLKMGSGRLSKQQVQAIQHVVAAAVPKLKPARISIADDKGTLLARGFEDGTTGTGTTAEEMRQGTQQRLTSAVNDLLERLVGPGKVRTEVMVEMDFDRVTTSEERYDPEGQVVRSTRTIGEGSLRTDSDAPPTTVGQNLPDAGLGVNGGRSSAKDNRTDELVNYEISKKVVSQVREGGVVKRLSVAVLLDGSYEGDAKAYKPRSQEELNQFATLVRSAVGFDAKRGDTVEVVNIRFHDMAEVTEKPAEAFLFGLEKAEVMRIAEILVLSVVAILVILLVVRPLVTRAFETIPAGGEAGRRLLGDQTRGMTPALAAPPVPSTPGMSQEEMDAFEELIDIDKVEGRVKASSIRKIGEIIDKHPEEALSIIRTWMYQES